MSSNIPLDIKTPSPWNESEINILVNALKTYFYKLIL